MAGDSTGGVVDAARAYSRDQGAQFKSELFEMLRIPSLSGDPAHASDVRDMAEWLSAHMQALGFDNVEIMPTAGHPVVYGEWLGAGPEKPTLLVYGHYDVVPASLEDGWKTDPFEPVEIDGKIYARGATDDKGQLFIHIKALESYLRTSGAAPVNVKFLLEGEEEVSSPNLTPFVEKHLEKLRGALVGINPALGTFRGAAGTIFPALAKMLSMTPGTARAFSWAASSRHRARGLIESTGSHLDPDGIEFYRRLLSDRDHVSATLDMMANWDLAELTGDLGRIRTPALFLVGSKDRAVLPESVDRASRRIPGARLTSFSAGHLLHEESPHEVADAILDWLDQCGCRAASQGDAR